MLLRRKDSAFLRKKQQKRKYLSKKLNKVHKIYGTSEEDGVISVYMKSFFAGFNRATGLEEETGMVKPVVIRLSETEGTYSVVEYLETEDGGMWETSLNEMFPKKYYKKALKNSGHVRDLQKVMDRKVTQWLGEQK